MFIEIEIGIEMLPCRIVGWVGLLVDWFHYVRVLTTTKTMTAVAAVAAGCILLIAMKRYSERSMQIKKVIESIAKSFANSQILLLSFAQAIIKCFVTDLHHLHRFCSCYIELLPKYLSWKKRWIFFLFFVIVSQCIEIQQRKNAKQYEIEED